MTELTIPTWSELGERYSVQKGGEWDADPTEDLKDAAKGSQYKTKTDLTVRDYTDENSLMKPPTKVGVASNIYQVSGTDEGDELIGHKATASGQSFSEGKTQVSPYPEFDTRESRRGRELEAQHKRETGRHNYGLYDSRKKLDSLMAWLEKAPEMIDAVYEQFQPDINIFNKYGNDLDSIGRELMAKFKAGEKLSHEDLVLLQKAGYL